MLTAADFIRAQLARLHTGYDKALAELSAAELFAVPGGSSSTANTIGWIVWHYVRTEDNVVRWVVQNRRPPVWVEGGYAEKLGLPATAQGTGMSTAEAQALRIKDLALFREYVQKVWASTDEFFAGAAPDVYDRVITVKPLGDMPVIQCLGTVCLVHGATHLGEIDLARAVLAGGGRAASAG